uniref:Uncharacterized protein n=1 Tax=Rhizophora mucronata TaxID=61149 RepID=A0A2P2R0G4_RHIMU
MLTLKLFSQVNLGNCLKFKRQDFKDTTTDTVTAITYSQQYLELHLICNYFQVNYQFNKYQRRQTSGPNF